MKKISLLFLMSMFVLAFFDACKGGEDGEDGETGTANVIYSDWIQLTGNWRDSTIRSDNYYVRHFNASDLTQEIIDSGVVMCYVKMGTWISPLPVTDLVSDTYGMVTFADLLEPGKIIITALFSNSSTTASCLNTSAYFYRYIIIPGGMPATKSTIDYTSISYEDLCHKLGVPK
jgi:hypothetical protein